MDRKSNFWEDVPRGDVGEELLRQIANAYIAKGEHGVEVKTDYKASQTGEVFIECESRGHRGGIDNTDAEWFSEILSGNKYNCDVLVIARTIWLRQKCQEKGFLTVGGDNNTSRGYLIDVRNLLTPLTGKPRQFNLELPVAQTERLEEGGSQILARIMRQHRDAQG